LRRSINKILIISGLSLVSLTVIVATLVYQAIKNPNLTEKEPEINQAIAAENQLRQQWTEAAFKINASAFLGADNFSFEQINSTDENGNFFIPDIGYIQLLASSQASRLRIEVDRELKSEGGKCNEAGYDAKACLLQKELTQIDDLESQAVALKSNLSDMKSVMENKTGFFLMQVTDGDNASFVKTLSSEEILVLTTFLKLSLDQAASTVSIQPLSIDPLYLNEMRKILTEAKLYTLSQQGRSDVVGKIKEIEQGIGQEEDK
jgi:hypothetical protein